MERQQILATMGELKLYGMKAAYDEIIKVCGQTLPRAAEPDVIAVLGPEADAGAVVQPEATALRLPGWDLQPLAPPDPLDPLVVDQPAGPAQQLGDLAIAVAAILPGQLDEVGRQPPFILTAVRDLALRRAVLSENTAGHALGHAVFSHHVLDAGAATGGA